MKVGTTLAPMVVETPMVAPMAEALAAAPATTPAEGTIFPYTH